MSKWVSIGDAAARVVARLEKLGPAVGESWTVRGEVRKSVRTSLAQYASAHGFLGMIALIATAFFCCAIAEPAFAVWCWMRGR